MNIHSSFVPEKYLSYQIIVYVCVGEENARARMTRAAELILTSIPESTRVFHNQNQNYTIRIMTCHNIQYTLYISIHYNFSRIVKMTAVDHYINMGGILLLIIILLTKLLLVMIDAVDRNRNFHYISISP